MNLDGLQAVYLVRFSTSVVKVGRSADPKKRIGQHRHSGNCFGVSMTNHRVVWVSNSIELERLIKKAFKQYGRPLTGSEWFKGFTWEEALYVFQKVTDAYGEGHG